MPGFRSIAMAACLWAVASPAPAQAPSQPPGSGTIRDVVITGVRELGENVVRGAIPVQTGAPTSDSLEHIAEAVERRYRDEGYSFAHVTPTFDEASGTLSLTIDEGIIDGVRIMATAGTVAERDADDVGDVVFGRQSESTSLGSLGRMI